MHKQEFLARLRRSLAGLPQGDIEERVSFYSEMIDDRMEEGLSEEEAVAAVGSLENFAELSGAGRKAPRRVWETVFLILGAPVWLSLLVAGLAVVFSLYVSLWAVLISLWAVFASVVVCALCSVVAGIVFVIGDSVSLGAALAGTGLVCMGLGILLFLGCKWATKGTLLLTKKTAMGIRNRFTRREER